MVHYSTDLRACERDRVVGVCDSADQLAGVDVWEGPVLVGAGGEHEVSSGV